MKKHVCAAALALCFLLAGRFFRLRAILFRRSLLPAAGFRHGRTGSAAFGPSL